MKITNLEIIDSADKISLICDDEEQTAWPMYQIYRKIKLVYLDAHAKMRAITFADDQWSFGLQAADMVVSITRQEANRRFFGTQYEYGRLFDALTPQALPQGEALWLSQFGFCGASMLQNLGQDWVKRIPRTLADVKAIWSKS
jgi:hypothetical protein